MTAWYRTGTVTATNGSGTVTGNLTAWLANAKVGDIIYPDADSKGYEITAVGSNTSITISPVYAGTTGSGKAYGIARTSTAWNSASELSVQIAQFISTFDPLGLSQLSDPNADRIPFWDESSGTAGAMAWLTLAGLGISGTTMSVDADIMSTARWPNAASAVSATTTDVFGQTSPYVTVTGSTGPIVSLGNLPNRFRIVRFTGTPTITHNGTTLILPNAANLTVLSGSVHAFITDASGNVRWLWSNELSMLTTAAARALLDDATTADQLTTLGVSAYVQTLLDDANPAEAQATLGVRAVLTGTRNYYVRADGNDANTGLANTSGAAFLTIQKAIDTAAALDTSIYGVTINVDAGTFAGVTLKDPVGAGLVTINGVGATTIISSTSAHTITANGSTKYRLQNLKITNSGGVSRGIYASEGAFVRLVAGIEFGSVAAYHIDANTNSAVQFFNSYTISGGGLTHWYADNGGKIIAAGLTITLSGTPAFATFAAAANLSLLRVNANTFVGSGTGKRYDSSGNSVIYTNGGGDTYLPGSIAGTTGAGGQYS